jgi:hypothetical protein
MLQGKSRIVRKGNIQIKGMAFKRSAVRSRLAPPRYKKGDYEIFRNHLFLLYSIELQRHRYANFSHLQTKVTSCPQDGQIKVYFVKGRQRHALIVLQGSQQYPSVFIF